MTSVATFGRFIHPYICRFGHTRFWDETMSLHAIFPWVKMISPQTSTLQSFLVFVGAAFPFSSLWSPSCSAWICRQWILGNFTCYPALARVIDMVEDGSLFISDAFFYFWAGSHQCFTVNILKWKVSAHWNSAFILKPILEVVSVLTAYCSNFKRAYRANQCQTLY